MSCKALVKSETKALVHCPEHKQQEPDGCTVECRVRKTCDPSCGDYDKCGGGCKMPPCSECEGWITNQSIILKLERDVCGDCFNREQCLENYGLKCKAFKLLYEQTRKLDN